MFCAAAYTAEYGRRREEENETKKAFELCVVGWMDTLLRWIYIRLYEGIYL